jgi:tubulin--tyrosine ligase
MSEIKAEVSERIVKKKTGKRTYIVQQYIDRPFLYKKRKFDIRCFILLTRVNGRFKGSSFHKFSHLPLNRLLV